MPNGADTTTAAAAAAIAAAPRSRGRRIRTRRYTDPTPPSAPNAGLINTAAATSSPTARARPSDGASRYHSAARNAPSANASVGPSEVMPLVTHSTQPLGVTTIAAISAFVRVVNRRPMRYVNTVAATPAIT